MQAIDARSDAFFDLVDERSTVERVASGFEFTEGPVWHPTGNHLLFSDIPANVRYRYWPGGTVEAALRPSHKSNGMSFDADLNLLVCEHATSLLVRERPDGKRETIASHFDGRELNSPNDVCVRSDGSIYFTDPWYGRQAGHGEERERELGFQGVYRVPPRARAPELLVRRDTYAQPNGLCFSPDESLLYVDDTPGGFINVYDVEDDGGLVNERRFFSGIGRGIEEEGVTDGMKCDERGNVWVTGPAGVWVISSVAEHLGVIRVPETTTNLAWGGEDWHTLFITAATSLYAIRTNVGPRREPFMDA